MICAIALIVAGVLGIFSVSYRRLAIDAFNCVFRNVTFRRCTSGTDVKLKSHITGSLLHKSPKTARFIRKRFEILSWFFAIILVISLIYSGIAIYNWQVHGNCNGPESDGVCILNDIVGHEDIPQECVGKILCEDCGAEVCGGESCTCKEDAENCAVA